MLRDWGFIGALVLARMAFGYQFQSVASIAPELTDRFQLSYSALGTLIGLYMLPGVVVALPGGFIGRRFGGRVVASTGLALMTAGCLLGATVFTPTGIGAGRLLSGCGAVLIMVMQGQLVSERFPGPRFLPMMSLLVGAFPLGVGMAALTRGVLGSAGPSGLLWVGAVIAGTSLALFASTATHVRSGGARWAWPSRRECGLVIVAGLVWMTYNTGYYGFLSYLPSLLTREGHSPALIATVLTVSTWFNMPSTVLGGWMAVRWGNGRVFVAGTVAGVVAISGPALADWPLVWGLLFGTGAALHAGVIVAVGTLSARPENRAVGMGLFYTTYYLGGSILPSVCGWAADRAGTPAGALLTAALVSAMGLPAWMLHRWMQRPPA